MTMKKTMKKTLVLPLIIILIATATICTASTLSSVTTSIVASKPRLSIETPYEVWEGQSFRIQVLACQYHYNLPVPNATVCWMNQSYLTNSTGCVILTAPQVSFNTFYYIHISKRGYQDFDDRILVKDGSAPQLQLAIPPSMMEGRQFRVGVCTSSGPVSYANVYWLNMSYLTNENGTVDLVAPEVNENTNIEIMAHKVGYLDAIGSIMILDENHSLLKLAIPESMMEGRIFCVGVYTEAHGPVASATVEWLDRSYLTNDNGIVNLQAPSVDHDTYFSISTHKEGYTSSGTSLLILDENTTSPLSFFSLDPVTESMGFTVTVSGPQGPVSGASVVWLNHSCLTNQYGQVDLVAPVVLQDTYYPISAHKEGFIDASGEILILEDVRPQLVIITPSRVQEGSIFTVRVEANNQPVPYVNIYWMNTTYVTNDNGTIQLTAPYIEWNVDLQAYKNGYISALVYIYVYEPFCHPADRNFDFSISLAEVTAYAADHQGMHATITATDIWLHGEAYQWNNYQNDWCPFHPADVNHDFNIQIEEITAYAASHGANDPDVQSATMLWQHGESYFFDYSSHNWMPVY